MERDQTVYWVWFSSAAETGTQKTDALTEMTHCDPRAIYEGGEEMYRACRIEGALLSRLCDKSLRDAEQIVSDCERAGIRIVTQDTDEYPEALRRISSRPILLYVRGELPVGERHLLISVVGTRRMTWYGKQNAYQIGFDLARHGVCVVSGLARGVDGEAHRGCLDAGGKTVAVLGCGLNICYPAEHRGLLREVCANGAAVSEYRPNRRPEASFFPARNRIISGLCRGTLVVEADEKSGAMITARRALTQGRDIFALPGNVGEQNSRGTNALIRNGAQVAETGADVVKPYLPLFSAGLIERIPCEAHRTVWQSASDAQNERDADASARRSRTSDTSDGSDRPKKPCSAGRKRTERTAVTDTDERLAVKEKRTASPAAELLVGLEKRLYESMPDGDSVGLDELARDGISPAQALTACTMLEIQGLIESVPGGRYRKKYE